ncbi:ribbon-helix-helix protein, CopG family [Candidatus Palauibacter sp.]|uniref:ribbon-helix-helix protein, CopG family n=1 Tax=Candidatus Palauibacter sp. TaxID=3101350 RepID=UPI003AF241BC
MAQIKVRLPDVVFDAIEASALALGRSREEIVQRALERYLEDFGDLAGSARRFRDPDD